jgi:hypothetical protein
LIRKEGCVLRTRADKNKKTYKRPLVESRKVRFLLSTMSGTGTTTTGDFPPDYGPFRESPRREQN